MFYNFIVMMVLFACTSPAEQNGSEKHEKLQTKPPSSFHDTLRITASSAVFYQPDSMQLKKIRQVTEERVFEGSMHEFFYQQRYAHLYFKKHWPQLTIIDVKNIRYLLFEKSDKRTEMIDLDKLQDAYGLILFSSKQSPLQIDMMNVETQVNEYFNKID